MDPNQPDRSKMSIDERMAFLQSCIESHDDQLGRLIEEATKEREEAAREREEERKHRRAMLLGIQAYLKGLDSDDKK